MTTNLELRDADDDDLIEIKIPLIVTADGYWAAMGSHRALADKDHPCPIFW